MKSTTSNSGGYYQLISEGGLSISHTIGQSSLINRFQSDGLNILQGFQHPYLQYHGVPDQKISEISVYPNPSTGKVKLTWLGENTPGEVKVSLVDANGKLFQEDYRHFADETIEMDYTNLARGAYLIRILDSRNRLSSALIILN